MSLNRRTFTRFALGGLAAAVLATGFGNPALAAEKKTYNMAWSIYAGWMPWPYAQSSGILKKWADKYNIVINLKQMDYIESINQFTAGKFDVCLMTNMDALTIPAAGGVDTTLMIVGDYSNGNDGLVLKGKTALKDIKGQKINLVEYSVSHYFLARALASIGLTEKDVKVVNTSDADIVAACRAHGITALLTRTDHPSGSDRLAEACALLDLPDDTVVVNVQGDEPLIEPALIDAVAAELQARPDCVMSTAAHAIDTRDEWLNPNVVKVVYDAKRLAPYFSRAPISWWR